MAVSKQKKGEILEKLRGIFAGAQGVALVNFKGLSVSATGALRRALKAQGVGYFVAKKTLITRALEESKFEGNLPALPGELAVAWSDSDQVAPAREIFAFGKKAEGALALVGGLFERRYMDKLAIEGLATIPAREVLLAQFVHLINSPLQRLAVALDQIAKKKAS